MVLIWPLLCACVCACSCVCCVCVHACVLEWFYTERLFVSKLAYSDAILAAYTVLQAHCTTIHYCWLQLKLASTDHILQNTHPFTKWKLLSTYNAAVLQPLPAGCCAWVNLIVSESEGPLKGTFYLIDEGLACNEAAHHIWLQLAEIKHCPGCHFAHDCHWDGPRRVLRYIRVVMTANHVQDLLFWS